MSQASSMPSPVAVNRKAALWTGRAMSGLIIAFMLFDSLGKLALESHVVQATTALGYPLSSIRPIGAILLAITALYAIPRTAIWGAILMTGFLGGAVAAKVRVADPLFSSVLFGVYFALIAWGGLYLRDDGLRRLLALRR